MKHFRPIDPDWLPFHCPNPKCNHANQFSSRSDFKRIGYYRTQAHPECIPRFLCKACGRSFSRQSFSTTYWQKLPFLDSQIFMRLVGCMGNRQIARDLGITHETVRRHIQRLGRHCLLWHARLLQRAGPFSHVVVDGFETFEHSQYFPFHHNLAVDPHSSFFIYHNDSELRRKGRMTDYQRRRRADLEARFGRPDPKAIERDVAELLEVALKGTVSALVDTDEHPAYRRSLARVPVAIRHRRTRSQVFRDHRNALFEVNLLDGLIRHSQSNHKRETIAFSGRRQASAIKLTILQVWRNVMKWRSENRPGQTPAMVLGLCEGRQTVADVLAERVFYHHVELPARWRQYYRGEVTTRRLPRNRLHSLSYAW